MGTSQNMVMITTFLRSVAYCSADEWCKPGRETKEKIVPVNFLSERNFLFSSCPLLKSSSYAIVKTYWVKIRDYFSHLSEWGCKIL